MLRAVAIGLGVVLLPGLARAHAIGISRGEYSLESGRLQGTLIFARGEVASLVPSLDADKDGTVSAAELASGQEAIRSAIVDRVEVSAGGSSCPGTLDATALVEGDGLKVSAHWICPTSTRAALVSLHLLDDLAAGHRHLAQAGPEVAIAYRGSESFEVTAASTAGVAVKIGAMFRMGVEHILTGWDHLVFLLGLILVGGRTRSLVGVITAFTIGHSITLALATLGVVAPGPRLVEPAIALSIAYVGIENFFVADVARRWRITLPFGLIHGFGFAGALREIQLPRPAVPLALVSFNLGVEAGQLAVLAVVLPLVLWLRRRPEFGARGVHAVSGLIVAAGAIWFVQRAFFA